MPPFELPAPPPRPDGAPLWATAAIPVVGSLGTVAIVLGGGRRQLLIGMALTVATLGALALQAVASSATRRRQLRIIRERYARSLDRALVDLRRPPLHENGLPVTVGTRARTIDFLIPDDDPAADPVCIASRDRFVEAYSVVPDAPHVLDLATAGRLQTDRAHAREIVLCAVESHPPGAVGLQIHSTDPEAWAWAALTPHLGGSGHQVVVVEGHPTPPDAPNTTVLQVLPTATAPYTATPCGPAQAAVRARRVGADAPESDPTGAAWTVTLGRSHGQDVRLDLREAAEGGIGPHGLLVGATGSGKSELLRQILGQLIAHHSSDDLRLALLDFKGGATFAPFQDVPHVAAYVTNLSEPGATQRLTEALEGELTLRQRTLAEAGAPSIREHPMPRLLIVIDEFTELLAADPTIADLFSRVGRLGRSLGIHLLLSTQRLEDSRLHGLEAHLSYRIALRTFTAAESRLAIGSPDASELPLRPGSGILATGGTLQRFQAHDPSARTRDAPAVEVITLRKDMRVGPTVFEENLRRASGRPAPRLWLPPLDGTRHLAEFAAARPMCATIGVVDRPREQRIDPLTLDLTGQAGHVAIVGGPRSGKSTALRTLASSLRRSTPDVRLLGLDLTGGLENVLPPERIATARTPDRVERLLRHLRRSTEGRASPPVVVLVDSWSAMRDNYGWLDALHQIAEQGLAADVHLAVVAHRWSDLRPSVRDLFGSRIELRLGDPLESEVDRRLAAGVPPKPGHGLIAPGYAVQLALDSTA